MARGYFTTKISDHMEETPEGNLIAPGCVIARTGFQTYKVGDLPQEAAQDLGIDTSDPRAEIDLYRPADEVFSVETLNSAEGKAVTDNHPPDFINPDNFSRYAQGHLQNVRKGREPLDSGEWPMLGDVHITAEPLLSRVRNHEVREISLGYDYSIRREDERINQCDMVINHLAIVPKGRAGPEARINDAAPDDGVGESLPTSSAPPDSTRASPPVQVSAAREGIDNNAPLTPAKERKPVKNGFLHLLGLGIRAKAADADTDPEELAQAAADAMNIAKRAESAGDRRGRAADKRGKDEDEPLMEEDPGDVEDKKGKDKKGKDSADDRHADDGRKRMHDALDKMMDARKGKDADMEELASLLGEYLGEEAAEPEHAAADEVELNPSELEAALEDDESEPGEEIIASGEEAHEEDAADDGMSCAHCGTAHDEEACPECGCRDKKGGDSADDRHADDRGKARDAKPREKARAVDGAAAVLKMIRPVVARTNDSAVRNAFNTALASVTKKSRVRAADSGGKGYGKFSAAARSHGADGRRGRAADSDSGAKKDPNAALQSFYDEQLKGGK